MPMLLRKEKSGWHSDAAHACGLPVGRIALGHPSMSVEAASVAVPTRPTHAAGGRLPSLATRLQCSSPGHPGAAPSGSHKLEACSLCQIVKSAFDAQCGTVGMHNAGGTDAAHTCEAPVGRIAVGHPSMSVDAASVAAPTRSNHAAGARLLP